MKRIILILLAIGPAAMIAWGLLPQTSVTTPPGNRTASAIDSIIEQSIDDPSVDSASLQFPSPTPEHYVATLDSLDFFRYADSPYVDLIRKEMIASFDPDGPVGYRWNETLGGVQDHRIFGCDGEELYQRGGMVEKLTELKPSFERRGLRLQVDTVHEEVDRAGRLTLILVVNGRRHNVFERHDGGLTSWGDGAYRFGKLLNAELAAQNTSERVYLASGGNDGVLYLLTPEQFAWLDRVHRTLAEKPLGVEEWGMRNQASAVP